MAIHVPERPDYIAMNLNVEDTVRCSDGIWSVRVSLRNRSYSGLYPSIQITDPNGKKHVTLTSLSEYASKEDVTILRDAFNRVRNRAYEKYAREITESKRIERQIAEFERERMRASRPDSGSAPKVPPHGPGALSARLHPFPQTQKGTVNLVSQQRQLYQEQQRSFRPRDSSQSSTRPPASRLPIEERPVFGRATASRRSPSLHPNSLPVSTPAYPHPKFPHGHQQQLRNHPPSHPRPASGSHAGPNRLARDAPRSLHHAAHAPTGLPRDTRPSSSSHPPRNYRQPDDANTGRRIVQRAAPGARHNAGQRAAGRANMQASQVTFDRIADAVDEELIESGDEEEESRESRSSSHEESDDEQSVVDLEEDEYSVANGRSGKRRGGGDAGEEADDKGRPRKRMKGDPQLLDEDERVEFKGPAMAQRICEVNQQKWRIQVVLEWEASKRYSTWVPAWKLMRDDGTTYSFATVQRDLPDIYEDLVTVAKDVITVLPRN